MKIWKAELILFYSKDNMPDTRFTFEEQEKDYKINDLNTEYIHSEDWTCDRIPIKMTIEKDCFVVCKVVQGFDHQLDKNELGQLEKNMRSLLQKQLEYEKEIYLKKYEEKLKVVKGI